MVQLNGFGVGFALPGIQLIGYNLKSTFRFLRHDSWAYTIFLKKTFQRGTTGATVGPGEKLDGDARTEYQSGGCTPED